MINLENKNPANNIGGFTPLHYAAFGGSLEVCEYIMKDLKNKNPKAHNGWTPLHWAAQECHGKILKFITENVEEKNPKDNFGRTPKEIWKTESRKIQDIF